MDHIYLWEETKVSLFEINQEYERIMESDLSDMEKAKRFSELMTDMERQFKIPMIRNEGWEKENRKVIALYRKISMSRSL